MRRRILLALGTMLMPLACLMIVPAPASADCVECSYLGDCEPDVSATACSCEIRVVRGRTICREMGFSCAAGSDCSGGGILQLRPKMAVDEAAFTKFLEKEPFLALLLMGSVEYDAKHQAFLSAEPYPGGTISGKGEIYKHRGMFSLRSSGEVDFHFVLTNEKDGSTVTYSGTLRDRGRNITSVKLSQGSTAAPAEREQLEWKMAN